jgi:arsenite methyltransferase
MSAMLRFDEENARRLEAVYMTPDVVEQRAAIRAALALQPGERVLDIGSGPGFLATEMAQEVGSGGRVVGIDPSESMLAIAERHAGPGAAGPVEFKVGDALSLPLEPASFDAAVSTQVLEYVDDVPAALAEARRVLRPGGRLLVLDTDWDTAIWQSGDADRTRRVMAAWNEHLVDPYLPRRLPRLLREAGLELTHLAVIPLLNNRYDPNTYSAGMVDLVAVFVPGRQGVTEAEASAWKDDLTGLGDDYFFSLNRYLFVAVA